MDSTIDARLDSGRHPVNTGHLVMGLVFAGLVGIWALVAGDVVDNDDIRWLLPIPWVAGGAIGLAAATWANVRSRRTPAPHGNGRTKHAGTTPRTATKAGSTTDDTEEIR